MKSTFKNWLKVSLTAMLVLISLVLGLPAILLILNIPSLEIGSGEYWLLRWQNDASGSGIEANILMLLIAAVVIGLFFLLSRLWSSQHR